jgi:hypothetical protein
VKAILCTLTSILSLGEGEEVLLIKKLVALEKECA